MLEMWRVSPEPGRRPRNLTIVMACTQQSRRLPQASAPEISGAVLGLVALLAAFAAGCTAHTEPTSAEIAWTARAHVDVRAELGPREPVIASLPLGAKVDIIGRRRRLVRIRAAAVEGWVRSQELISSEVKQRQEILSERFRDYAPQGELRAFDQLNVHLEPFRWSPTIYQLRKNEGVELLARKSVIRRAEDAVAAPPDAPFEDWLLVRLPTGASGWLLGSRTHSAIPIEVAQYAEGRRILAYFGLGPVVDEVSGESKETWLWVQSPRARSKADFDRIRVFRWSNHRDAYQTIRLERGVEGYLPVTLLDSVQAKRGEGPGFRLIVRRDGALTARTYALVGQRVYLASEQPAPPRPQIQERVVLPAPEAPRAPTLSERMLSWLPSLL